MRSGIVPAWLARAGDDLDPGPGRDLAAEVAALDAAAPEDYRWLAALAAGLWVREGVTRIGVGGGQGAGKSTLARLLEAALEHRGRRAIVLSLDDFYLTRAERHALAERVHPLLETRGPPGTHDVPRLRDALEALATEAALELPVFDKARDDRVGTRPVRGPFDVVLLEGWCVGAEPLAPGSLAQPINDLERERDPDGRWRGFVAERLARDYVPLWSGFDAWLVLRVPSLAAVRRWRLEQERERPPERRLGAEAVARFVAHYERLTRAMLAQPARPGALGVELDEDHRVAALHRAPPGPGAGR